MSAPDTGVQQHKKIDDLIAIEFRNSSADDEGELQDYLGEKLGVKVYIELLESVHEHWPITTLFVSMGAVAARYAGKKVLDVVADLLKSWLQQKPNVTEIKLYGPDGEVAKVVKKK
jgi:hypothetical protein